MGIARKLRVLRGKDFSDCLSGLGVANALDIFEEEIRTLDEPSQESIDLIIQEFISMLCLPICATTFISPVALSVAEEGVKSAAEGVPVDIVEGLVRDMYCNLCPPWPLCPDTLFQCINLHLETTRAKQLT